MANVFSWICPPTTSVCHCKATLRIHLKQVKPRKIKQTRIPDMLSKAFAVLWTSLWATSLLRPRWTLTRWFKLANLEQARVDTVFLNTDSILQWVWKKGEGKNVRNRIWAVFIAYRKSYKPDVRKPEVHILLYIYFKWPKQLYIYDPNFNFTC